MLVGEVFVCARWGGPVYPDVSVGRKAEDETAIIVSLRVRQAEAGELKVSVAVG